MVRVIDSIMGSGKTTFAISEFNDNSTPEKLLKRYILATPKLKEVDEILARITGRTFEQPDELHGEGKKKTHFMKMVREGRDIITTHSMLERLTDEELDEIHEYNYTLVIDEAPAVFSSYAICELDKEMALAAGLISIDVDNRISWEKSDYSRAGVFSELREQLEEKGEHYNSTNAIVTLQSTSFWEAFADITIMTYMFDAQYIRCYFDIKNIEYEKYAVKDGKLVAYDATTEPRKALYDLIAVEGSKIVGEGTYELSKSYFENKATEQIIDGIKREMYAFSRRRGTKASQIIWTCNLEFRTLLEGKGYKDSYIAYTERATNEYRDRDTLLYVGNRFMNPNDTKFFSQRGIETDRELYAVSELLQWVFRSAIRDGKKVRMYLPSARMRSLLEKWANNEI